MSLLNIMMDLKKCCNHPYLFPVAAMVDVGSGDRLMFPLQKQGHLSTGLELGWEARDWISERSRK